jgi:hypothetical protein
MEQNTFVYPAHHTHAPYRMLTRETELVTSSFMGNPDINFSLNPFEILKALGYASDKERSDLILSEMSAQRIIEETGGLNLCSKKIERRGLRTGGIRLGSCSGEVITPTAFEVLAFGTGVLRERFVPYRIFISNTECKEAGPKITSERSRTIVSHIAFNEGRAERNTYDSTNEILADTYGELEQLANRRGDEVFLSQYIEKMRETVNSVFEIPSDERQFILPGYPAAWFEHIRLGRIWERLPEDTDDLLVRVDFLLANTLIDEQAVEIFPQEGSRPEEEMN